MQTENHPLNAKAPQDIALRRQNTLLRKRYQQFAT